MANILKQAIADIGLPYLNIEQATGIKAASITRFMRGEQSLRLNTADKLAAYFGWQ